jgi:hypothetical protein
MIQCDLHPKDMVDIQRDQNVFKIFLQVAIVCRLYTVLQPNKYNQVDLCSKYASIKP